ncbi:winged helix-turn-helix transcriptional regulator [Spirillospora sp. NPDC048911]|uniref:winged helix-turn-helix transcriptional regulator n=1 Tax=Spirillospora sp. NPDC048911 TaxID=3364527 RepID=UPI00371376F2
MQRTSLAEFPCSIARTLDVFGEWWTPLIVRDVYLGLRRFEQIQSNLGISRKVLTQRLDRLVEEEILARRPYSERPPRHEYVLTERGRELVPILLALMAWGDRWTSGEDGPPMTVRHETCGHAVTPVVSCPDCREPLTADGVRPEPGPGARIGPGTHEIARVLGRHPG